MQRYLLNKIFIDDYCIWIQSQTDSYLTFVAAEIDKLIPTLSKNSTPGLKELDLAVVEQCAKECYEEEGRVMIPMEEEEERPKELL